MVIVKVLPLPSSLSTSILPFIKSTKFLTIAIPSPVPGILDRVVFLSRVNNSNKDGKNSSLIPIPVSDTFV